MFALLCHSEKNSFCSFSTWDTLLSCCPCMLVLQFMIVILVYPNTCTSDCCDLAAVTLTKQHALLYRFHSLLLCISQSHTEWTQMFADNMYMQCMEVFVELCRISCCFLEWFDPPLFFFHATLRTVQYTIKHTFMTEAVIYFWIYYIAKCIWCHQCKEYVCICIVRNDVWSSLSSQKGNLAIKELHGLSFVNSNARLWKKKHLKMFVKVWQNLYWNIF